MKFGAVRALCVGALTALAFSGCARTPEGSVIIPVRAFTVTLTTAAAVNDDFYYYTVIDTEGGGAGPLPVFPGVIPGQGWVTGSATHFVEYHRGQFTLCKFLDLDQFQYVRIGTPINASASGQTITFTIDLNDLEANGESIDLNFITMDYPLAQRRSIDALIAGSASTLNLLVTSDSDPDNDSFGSLEQPDDLLNENGSPAATTEITRPLDMIGWRLRIDI